MWCGLVSRACRGKAALMTGHSFVGISAALTIGAAVLSSCAGSGQRADIVLKNGVIATVDSSFTLAEAVAMKNGRIVYTGSSAGAKRFIGSKTRVVDLAGRIALPGLIDAHAHFAGYAASLVKLDFRGTKSFDEIADMVADEAKKLKPGEWVLGRSWDQNDWPVQDMPTHEALDRAAPENPVWLVRIDGHAGVANTAAMKLCGVDARSKSPSGGEILKKKDGTPSGTFIDEAMGLISAKVPDLGEERFAAALAAASDSCLAAGLTSVHEAGISPDAISLYKRLIEDGRLKLRIYAMLGDPGEGDIAGYFRKNRLDGYAGHRLDVRCVKLFIDGAMGSRGAALFEPYSDRPGYSGLLVNTPEHVEAVARAALDTGFQVAVHAIGDKGNRIVLNAFERALKDRPATDHRFRIEHAQVVSPPDFARFKALGVLPSMQPTHATSDMPWAEARLGPERVKGSYAWRSFLDIGCIVPCGSDFPVEEIYPMLGIYAGITRTDLAGNPPGGWRSEQKMTREEVIKGFTRWAAYAAFQDSILGSIETGKLADVVVLSRNILTIPPEEIPSVMVDMTIVGGKVVYERK